MEEHLEHIKKIKKMLGEFLGDIAEEKKIDGTNIAIVKETLSAYQKACWICEDLEEETENYGASRGGSNRSGGSSGGSSTNSGGGYSARRRNPRTGRFMDGGRGMVYGWMPVPGPYYDGQDKAELAEELESIAQSGSGEMANALREAARHLRNG